MNHPSNAEKLAQEMVDRVKATPHTFPTAPDVSAFKHLRDTLIKELKNDQEIRKWCIEQANGDVELAKNIYSFCHAQVSIVIDKVNSQP